MKVFTADILDKQNCGNPQCRGEHPVIYLESRCHPGRGYQARYVKADHTLTLECNECGQESGTILVATSNPQ